MLKGNIELIDLPFNNNSIWNAVLAYCIILQANEELFSLSSSTLFVYSGNEACNVCILFPNNNNEYKKSPT